LLFDDELSRVPDQVRSAPNLGGVFKSRRSGREYRRVLMPATRYHVYYRVAGPDQVRVVAIWSALRGGGPGL
jgi:plasmid stabilization system protein ParE